MDKKTFNINVRVNLDQFRDQELPEIMVYAFDRDGQLLSSTALRAGKQDEVILELPQQARGKALRVLIGPPPQAQRDNIPLWMDAMLQGEISKKLLSPSVLLRRGAYEKRVNLGLEKAEAVELAIYPEIWKKWLLCRCVVRGRLVKRVPLPDGTTREYGVCHACVKIYEVDKFYELILRLPERELFRLRDELRTFLEKQPTIGRFRPPAVLDNVSIQLSSQTQAELEPVFLALSSSELRTALAAKASILARFACIWEWLHVHFHKDLIRCVCTDVQGRFETTILYPCFGDKPDLYFKAVQCIGGTLHTLYDPGVACHTYWNYACGTEVVLEVTDPAARVCAPSPEVDVPPGVTNWIMPYGVGGITLNQIKGSGLTDFSDGNGTWVDVPFGGQLGFRHGWSSLIPIDTPGMPYYYRWMYNKLDNAGNETEWREFAEPVANTVVRHYVDEVEAHPELPPTFPAYPLGPHSINSMHLYEFKPHQPPYLAGHRRYWPIDDWFNDIYTGLLQSANLPGGATGAAGKYKIRMEIYDKSGSHVAPGAGSFKFIVPTGLAADGTTIESRNAAPTEIEKITNDGKDYYGFIFYLHIDNNKCEAEIFDAGVNGENAGPCGFIKYPQGSNVRLSYRAYHPHGFARFKFTVTKGSSGYVGTASAPANPAAAAWSNAPLVTDSPNGYTNSPTGTFSKEVPVTDMLGGCPGKGAYSESLYVAATATNGWVRLSGLDGSAVPQAFALEPEPGSP